MWLVGRRIELLKNDGTWGVCEVLSWNPQKSSHKVVYNDGETKDHVMSQMYYRILKSDENANSLGIEPLLISFTRDGKTDNVKECLGCSDAVPPVNRTPQGSEDKDEKTEIPWDEMYDINIQNSFGNTALHIAASWARTDIASLLLAKGADLSAKNSVGGTPLHWAARYGKVVSIELLAKAGANMNALDNDGKTPADVAESLKVAEAVIANGGIVTEKFYNVGGLIRIRENMWDDKKATTFPKYGWPKGMSAKDIEFLRNDKDGAVGTITKVVSSTDEGQGKLLIDFNGGEVKGWEASPNEVISVVKPCFLIGSENLADAASWKASLSIIDHEAEKSGYVESITMILSRIPRYSKLNLNVFERIRDRQFALISTVSVAVDKNIVSPDVQTIKLKKSERPKIGKGQYLGLSCSRGHHLNIHSRSSKGYKTNIFYGEPPSRRGQISTFKSYMGSDKRGTTAAGWYASIVVDNNQDSTADENEDSMVTSRDSINPKMKSSSPAFDKGDRVMAMWKEGRQPKYAGFYPATILSVNANGTYALKYDDGYSDKSVHQKFVRSAEDNQPRSLEKSKPSSNQKPKLNKAGQTRRRESAEMLASMKERRKSIRSKKIFCTWATSYCRKFHDRKHDDQCIRVNPFIIYARANKKRESWHRKTPRTTGCNGGPIGRYGISRRSSKTRIDCFRQRH